MINITGTTAVSELTARTTLESGQAEEQGTNPHDVLVEHMAPAAESLYRGGASTALTVKPAPEPVNA